MVELGKNRDLSTQGRIKNRSHTKAQGHIDKMAGKAHDGKNQNHRQSQNQPHHHLLQGQDGQNRPRTQIPQGIKGRQRHQGAQGREAHLDHDGHIAHAKQGRGGEKCGQADKT